jgi:hypothetical protein
VSLEVGVVIAGAGLVFLLALAAYLIGLIEAWWLDYTDVDAEVDTTWTE